MKHAFSLISSLAATSLVMVSVFGQEIVNYKSSIAGFNYVEVTKSKGKGKLPLVIAFHYSRGKPLETIADYDSLKIPIRIIIPLGNYKKGNGFSYYPTDYYQKDSLSQFTLSGITVDSIANFVQLIEKKYKQKAIVSGVSQGGDIAFLLAVRYPKLCRASFPFAAIIHSNIIRELGNKHIKKIPIHLFQGETDPIVPVNITRNRVKMVMKKLNIKLHTYPEVGHDISIQMKIDYSKLIDEINVKQ
jgi:predicted esterase